MKRIMIGAALLGALAFAITLFVLRKAEAQNTPEQWQVEVDVMSGLPNPVFELTPSELSEVKVRMSRAQALSRQGLTASSNVRPSILGYRGLILRNIASQRAAPELEIYQAKVLSRSTGTPALVDDQGASLERYLLSLATAKGLLPSTLADTILRSLP
jgi:hypothetical protein